MAKKQSNANEYYAERQNDQLDGETPAQLNVNNHSHGGEDRLFHLQQELLREELSQRRWREVQYNQSQRLEQSLQQEELLWQRRRYQARQGGTSRESTPSEHGEWGMEMGGGGREMGGSFNLDNIHSNNGHFSSPIMRSGSPSRLLIGRTSRGQRDVNFSCFSRGQSNHSNSIGKEGQLSAQRSRSTGSLRNSSGTSNNNGNSYLAARGSYHDECIAQNHSKQYVDARSSSNNQSPDILPFQPSRSDRGGENFTFQNNSFDPKRRRLNFYDGEPTSNEKLMLEMLTDTVVSPTTTKTIHAQSLVADIADSEHDTTDKPALMDGVLSPFSRYIKPISHENASLTPLPQSRGNGNIGNTHRMFADFLLDSTSGGSGGGLDVSAMPPPPLVHNIDFSRKNLSEESNLQPAEKAALKRGDITNEIHLPRVCDSLDSLPLPRRKSQQRNFPPGKKRPNRGKGQKKSKDRTASSTSDPTANHIITPSSAIISALSAEVRLKMKLSSMQDRNVAKSPRSDGKDSNSGDVFFVPNFASAMEKSQASQQAIHDWDRAFGLRRAHSKTMRESCRSRKKVLEFLKGEGASLLLWKKSSSFGKEEEERGVVQELDNLDDILHNAKLEQDQAHNITECTLSTKNETGGESGVKVDVQLEQMFRRASLDSAKSMLPGEFITGIPSSPQEADRKQFHANSA